MDPAQQQPKAARRPRTAIVLLAGALALVAYEASTRGEETSWERWARERREPVRAPRRGRLVMVDYSRPRNAGPEPKAPPRSGPSAPDAAPTVSESAPPAVAPPGSAPPVESGPAPESAPPDDPEPPCDPASFRLTRVVFDPGDPDTRFAVIDGRAVRTGETIRGWVVREISRDLVELEGRGVVLLTPGTKESR